MHSNRMMVAAVLAGLGFTAPVLAQQDDRTTLGGQQPGSDQPTGQPAAQPTAQPSAQVPSQAPYEARTAQASEDSMILSKLHDINQHEITAGNLAKQKGDSSRARRFGEQLVKDHEALEKKVMSLAQKNNVLIGNTDHGDPAYKAEMQKHEAQMLELNNLTGPGFDRTFMAGMIEGHEKAIALINSSLLTVQDAATKKLLQNTVPMLRKHHQMAIELAPPVQGRRGTAR